MGRLARSPATLSRGSACSSSAPGTHAVNWGILSGRTAIKRNKAPFSRSIYLQSNSSSSELRKKRRAAGSSGAQCHYPITTTSRSRLGTLKAKPATAPLTRPAVPPSTLHSPGTGRFARPEQRKAGSAPHYRITSKALCVPRLISSSSPASMPACERLAQEATLPPGARGESPPATAPPAARRCPWVAAAHPPLAPRLAVGLGRRAQEWVPSGPGVPRVRPAQTARTGSRSRAQLASRGFLMPSLSLLCVDICLSCHPTAVRRMVRLLWHLPIGTGSCGESHHP